MKIVWSFYRALSHDMPHDDLALSVQARHQCSLAQRLFLENLYVLYLQASVSYYWIHQTAMQIFKFFDELMLIINVQNGEKWLHEIVYELIALLCRGKFLTNLSSILYVVTQVKCPKARNLNSSLSTKSKESFSEILRCYLAAITIFVQSFYINGPNWTTCI